MLTSFERAATNSYNFHLLRQSTREGCTNRHPIFSESAKDLIEDKLKTLYVYK